GIRIRERRNELGLTQEELGKALRDTLSHQQIQKYEKGENSISCARLVQIAEALGVTAGSLLEGVSAKSGSGGLHEPPATPFEHETTYDKKALNKAIESLPNADMRKAVVDFLKIVSYNTKKSA
ncbi:MAG: helix-turn-helix transcriptional regulator, partial [Alphaproteobacteria bacterium]|nr:helix-turn-helix transcriptional regulator [Alphaproteobacteria bacterium]